MRLFILIRRDPSESHQEFLDWWSGTHAELARHMPGLRRYVLHDVVKGFEKDVEWDGLAELEFDSEDSARAAFGSEAGVETMKDAMTKRGARLMLTTDTLRVVREA